MYMCPIAMYFGALFSENNVLQVQELGDLEVEPREELSVLVSPYVLPPGASE